LISAMLVEINLQKDYLRGQDIETIYFGGGTPSILPVSDLSQIIEAIRKAHPVHAEAEITLEANPEDIDASSLEQWKSLGINRLSIGVQGFQDEMLQRWNRAHQSDQSLRSLPLAMKHGFENISADLIYGDPLLSDEEWKKNIQTLAALNIAHISCYALTIETGTALHTQISKGKTKPVDDEQSHRQYLILQDEMNKSGYQQYEISNFGKPGWHSRHNMSYWNGIEYLGLGPSSHSFDTKSRQWNISNNAQYIKALPENSLSFEREIITPEKRYNELVMTGLRTSEGIDVKKIGELGAAFLIYLKESIEKFIRSGQITGSESGNFILSRDQYFFADGIASHLFYV